MLQQLLLQLSLAASVLAASNRTWGPVLIAGNPFSRAYPQADDALFQKNMQNPNATRSIKFKPFGSTLVNDPPIKNQEWTLRVNVSSMYIPNARSYNPGAPIPESHVVAFTWDLSWPGGGSLSSAVENNNTLCTTMSDSEMSWPVSIVNAYTEASANSTSCEPVFGKDCVKAILGTYDSGSGDRCQSPKPSWWDLPECGSSFGLAKKESKYKQITTWGISPVERNSTSRGSNATYGPQISGDAIGAQTMEPVGVDASSTYYAAVNRLHVIMLGTNVPQFNGGSQVVADLLCMRVNYTKLADNVRTDGNTTTVEDSVLKPTSRSARIEAGTIVSLAMGMFVAVAFLTGGL